MDSQTEHIRLKKPFITTLQSYYQLTKPGITLAVIVSVLVGFVLGSGNEVNYFLLFHTLFGSYLIAAGTGAHNQFMERKLDGLMKRTEKRPLPSQEITATSGKIFSLILILSGLGYLILLVNPVAAGVSFATTLIYLAAYTPMKQVSAYNIAIGAVPGALPPVGGWAAATGNIGDPAVWLLFGIVFLWQVPHVMAIAWLCKDDYSNAGFKMLPKNDFKGKKTAFWAIFCTISLFPVTYALYALETADLLFLVLGLALAVFFLVYGIIFSMNRSKENARKLMFASIAYLPLVWLAIFIDIIF